MNHEIFIAKDSGFCFGVKKAFDKTYELANNNNNICIYGEMVHNKYALNDLYAKGIIIKDNILEIIDNSNIEIVIIRAHGVSPEEEQLLINSKKKIIDLTCPKVKNIQLLAKKLTDEGFFILIYGKTNHPEVIGIKGYCKDNNLVIKEYDDIKEIPDITKKIALISQTTMNSDKFKILSDKIKTLYNNNVEIFDTLCKLPIKKQDEALKLSKKVSCMVVVGDKSSSNTITLFEKLKETTACFFIENTSDIDLESLKKYEKIGITGGSSTSYKQLEEIKDFLANNL